MCRAPPQHERCVGRLQRHGRIRVLVSLHQNIAVQLCAVIQCNAHVCAHDTVPTRTKRTRPEPCNDAWFSAECPVATVQHIHALKRETLGRCQVALQECRKHTQTTLPHAHTSSRAHTASANAAYALLMESLLSRVYNDSSIAMRASGTVSQLT